MLPTNDKETALEALFHAFILGVLGVGVLLGLALARLANWGHTP